MTTDVVPVDDAAGLLDDVAGAFDQITANLYSEFGPIFDQMEIAEEEIILAQTRHGEPLLIRDAEGRGINLDEVGPIWNSFTLLRPADGFEECLSIEMLYRQHCAEILDRVAEGLDTRAATGAELVIAISETSFQAPLTSSAAGVYMKLMDQYFPHVIRPAMDDIGRTVADYQKIHGQQMEADELMLRKKLRQEWRVAQEDV